MNIRLDSLDEVVLIKNGHLFMPIHPRKKKAELQAPKSLLAKVRRQDYKGSVSESSFLSLTNELIRLGKIPWAKAVRRASRCQDFRHRTDFRIRLRDYDGALMNIQVKSSPQGVRHFLENKMQPSDRIHVIWVDKATTLEKLEISLQHSYRREMEWRSKNLVTALE